MKTTVDIATSILRLAKRRAAAEGRTLRSLIEQALRQYLNKNGNPAQPFQLRRHSFSGRGLQTGVSDGNWESIRDLIYKP